MPFASGFRPDRRRHFLPAGIPRTTVHQGGLFADIVHDRRRQPPIFICIVQSEGSREVLFLGQYDSEAHADAGARRFMAEYLREHGEEREHPAAD